MGVASSSWKMLENRALPAGCLNCRSPGNANAEDPKNTWHKLDMAAEDGERSVGFVWTMKSAQT